MVGSEWDHVSEKCLAPPWACVGTQQMSAPSDHSPGLTLHSSLFPVRTMILVNICYLVDWHNHGYGWCLHIRQRPRGTRQFDWFHRDLFFFLRTWVWKPVLEIWPSQGQMDRQALSFSVVASRARGLPRSQGWEARKQRNDRVPGPPRPVIKAGAFARPALWSHTVRLLLHRRSAWTRSPEVGRSPSKDFYEVRDSSEET